MTTLPSYRTPPQQERKAAKEARASGHKAYLPTEPKTYRTALGKWIKRRVPTAPGYLFATGKPYDAKHIRTAVGRVSPDELRNLYVRSSVTQRRHAFEIGDQVSIRRGAQASLTGTIRRIHTAHWYDVAVSLFGKVHIAKLKEGDLQRLHPGT